MLKIAIASDHAGYLYKELVGDYLRGQKIHVIDFGTSSTDSVDYPIFIKPAALAVANGEVEYGIIFGGSGNGEAMVANRIKGIRCAIAWNLLSAEYAKKHNNANMLSLGQRLIPEDDLLSIVDKWLNSSFETGRHTKRINMIDGS